MRLLRFFAFFLFLASYYASYAHEKTHIFIGHNEHTNHPTFILQLIDDDIENYCQINEKGEVYLKVDTILPLSQEQSLSPLKARNYLDDPEGIVCSNPECKLPYYGYRGRSRCPRCGTKN